MRTPVRDMEIAERACARLGLPAPTISAFRIYESQAHGIGVRLPGWRYPVVFAADTGVACYDNYGGCWGAQIELDRFNQAYETERAKMLAEKAGYACTEQILPNGIVQLSIEVPDTIDDQMLLFT